jgi:hypothetical protein
MPQPNRIPKAFAASGDKNSIPESTGTLGLASWNEGFPAITSVPFSEGGLAPKRADFNGIFNALSKAVLWYQQGGIFGYSQYVDYEQGNLVTWGVRLYVCEVANGPSSTVIKPVDDVAGTYWRKVILFNATTTTDGYMSAEDKKLVDTIPNLGTFSAMFFSQTSGNFTAPYTGVYRITLKGGGGGGGGARTDVYATGGGGGEGGTLIFYTTLTADQSYPYVIGAGGAAGVNAANNTDNTNGGNGGTTSFNATYSITGGNGGQKLSSDGMGGNGGSTKTPNDATVYMIPGAMGENGMRPSNVTATGFIATAPNGGGNGARAVPTAPLYGAGGSGGGPKSSDMSTARDPVAGASGYILIEYAS